MASQSFLLSVFCLHSVNANIWNTSIPRRMSSLSMQESSPTSVPGLGVALLSLKYPGCPTSIWLDATTVEGNFFHSAGARSKPGRLITLGSPLISGVKPALRCVCFGPSLDHDFTMHGCTDWPVRPPAHRNIMLAVASVAPRASSWW